MLAEVYAQRGKTSGLTLQDLKSPQLVSYLSTVEQSVEHYRLGDVLVTVNALEEALADIMDVRG